MQNTVLKYPSQSVSKLYFIAALGLFVGQILFGITLGLQYVIGDLFFPAIPFNVARMVHTNLLIVWLLFGFMGSAYYLVPEESETELWSPKLAVAQWAALVVVGVIAIIGFHFNWWEGRKFLEIPRPLDWLVVVNVLAFIGNLAVTITTESAAISPSSPVNMHAVETPSAVIAVTAVFARTCTPARMSRLPIRITSMVLTVHCDAYAAGVTSTTSSPSLASISDTTPPM